MESVHYLMKTVAGAPNIRPAWFFDTAEQGEGLNDIGTHLVDLVQWTLFPDQAIDYRADVQRALRAALADDDRGGRVPARHAASRASRRPGGVGQGRQARVLLQHAGVVHAARRPHQAERDLGLGAGGGAGDTHFAYYRGSRARVEVRQAKADGYRPELYVIPATPRDKAAVLAAVRAKIAALQTGYPGVGGRGRGAEIHVTIPDASASATRRTSRR